MGRNSQPTNILVDTDHSQWLDTNHKTGGHHIDRSLLHAEHIGYLCCRPGYWEERLRGFHAGAPKLSISKCIFLGLSVIKHTALGVPPFMEPPPMIGY